MITANKYIKMLGMDVDEVCKAIDSLPEKDAMCSVSAYSAW